MDGITVSTLFVVLFFLLFCSAFFSSSETALMMLNRYRLKHLAEQGHKGAIRAEKLLVNPDRLIGLILLGNNFVNILASSIATLIAIKLGGEAAIALSTGILTFVVLIYAEVIPKTAAALHPERIAFPAAFVYTVLLKLLRPLIWLINNLTALHLKLLRFTRPDDTNALTHEELRTVVGEASALIPKKHKQMLLGLMDLEKITTEDIMVPRHEIVGIDISDALDDIEDVLESTPYTRLLVYNGNIDNVIGIIHSRRIMHMVMKKGEITKESISNECKPPYYIPEGTPLNKVISNFQEDRRRLGLVVDEYGDIQGLVTFGNIVEEIVGEFTTTPTTASLTEVTKKDDGSFVVNASINLRELNRITGWQLPTNGPKTLNGLILEHLEYIPEPNLGLVLSGYPIEILQIEETRVKVVRVYPLLKK